MRYVLFLILAIIGFALFGTFLSDYPGVVKITLPNGSYQMKLAFFIAAVVIFVVVAFVALRILLFIVRVPRFIRNYGKNNKKAKVTQLLQKGMRAMEKGQWRLAEKTLIKGSKLSQTINSDPSLFLSTAAVAAQNLGATARRDHYLLEARKLEAEGIDTVSAVLTEARLQLNEGNADEALKLLEPIKAKSHNNGQLIEIEYEANLASKNYDRAWYILPLLKKQFTNQDLYETKKKELALLIFENEHSTLGTIKSIWSKLSKENKQDHSVLLRYVSALIANNDFIVAEKVLADQIKQNYAPELIHAYTQLEQGSSSVAKLTQIKKWLKFVPDNHYLNYGAAKYSYQTEQYDDAKKYIELSLKESALPESYVLLGEVCETLGDESSAFKAYKAASLLTYSTESAVKGELMLKDEGSHIKKIEEVAS